MRVKTTLAVSIVSSLLFASPAFALFGAVREAESAVQEVESTVSDVTSVLSIIGYSESQLNSLMGTLGLSAGSIDFADVITGTDVAVKLFQGWQNGLGDAGQVIATQLITEYATGLVTNSDELSATSWFRGLAAVDQASALELFSDFEQITPIIDDQSSFLTKVGK